LMGHRALYTSNLPYAQSAKFCQPLFRFKSTLCTPQFTVVLMARIYSILAFKEIPHMPTKSEQIQAQLLNQPLAKPGMLLHAHPKVREILLPADWNQITYIQASKKMGMPIMVKGQFLE